MRLHLFPRHRRVVRFTALMARSPSTPAFATLTGRPPVVIAHRGASGYRPEHTLAAYELAIEQGADFIEPDLVMTKDGVPIARHEPEMSQTTDVTARAEFTSRRRTVSFAGNEVTGFFASDFTLSEIKTLRARERIPQVRPGSAAFDGRFQIPTFQEVLDLARTKGVAVGRTIGVYPETKHPTWHAMLGLPLEEKLVESLRAAGRSGRGAPVFIQSFEVANLKKLRRITDVRLVQLVEAERNPTDGSLVYGRPVDFIAAGDPRTYADLLTPAGLAEVATYADGIGPWKRLIVPTDAVNRTLRPTPLVRDAHAAGLLVHPWTFRTEAVFLAADYEGDPAKEFEQFYRLGVDGLFSDHPDAAVRVRAAVGGG